MNQTRAIRVNPTHLKISICGSILSRAGISSGVQRSYCATLIEDWPVLCILLSTYGDRLINNEWLPPRYPYDLFNYLFRSRRRANHVQMLRSSKFSSLQIHGCQPNATGNVLEARRLYQILVLREQSFSFNLRCCPRYMLRALVVVLDSRSR